MIYYQSVCDLHTCLIHTLLGLRKHFLSEQRSRVEKVEVTLV